MSDPYIMQKAIFQVLMFQAKVAFKLTKNSTYDSKS